MSALNGCRNRLKAKCYEVLDCLQPHAVKGRASVRARDHVNRVVLTVTAAATRGDPQPERFPGIYFSPTESAIYQAVLTSPGIGKQLARRCGLPYDGTFKVLLRNLVNRRVLRHAEGGGYAAATQDAGGGAKRE